MIDYAELTKPFLSNDLEWRIQKAFEDTKKAIAVPYVTARAIINRLNSVVGYEHWKDEYKLLQWEDVDKNGKIIPVYGMECKLSLRVNGEWLGKCDAAPLTDIEDIKGGYSDSLKRAGVKWGIGIDLYRLNEKWVELVASRPNLNDDEYGVHRCKSGQYVYWVFPVLDMNKELSAKPAKKQSKPQPEPIPAPVINNDFIEESIKNKPLGTHDEEYVPVVQGIDFCYKLDNVKFSHKFFFNWAKENFSNTFKSLESFEDDINNLQARELRYFAEFIRAEYKKAK